MVRISPFNRFVLSHFDQYKERIKLIRAYRQRIELDDEFQREFRTKSKSMMLAFVLMTGVATRPMLYLAGIPTAIILYLITIATLIL
jgi:hypothetical protein